MRDQGFDDAVLTQATRDGGKDILASLKTPMGEILCLVESVPPSEGASVREQYLTRHENSRSWVDFEDFGFYRLQPLEPVS
jgi:hypothetical protein